MAEQTKRKRDLDEVQTSCKKGKPTVRFNVGGRIYEVSRSLLDRYPDTMLARMASDTWSPLQRDESSDESGEHENGDDDDDDTPICNGDGGKKALFIDRNSDRFQYCLDYMRDGGIAGLPMTVSKDAVLHDLAYYGFHDVDPSSISVQLSLSMIKTSHEYIQSLELDLNKKLRASIQNQKYLKLVLFLLDSYRKDASLEQSVPQVHASYYTAVELTKGDRSRFNAHLEDIGFKIKNVVHYQRNTNGSSRVVFSLELL